MFMSGMKGVEQGAGFLSGMAMWAEQGEWLHTRHTMVAVCARHKGWVGLVVIWGV